LQLRNLLLVLLFIGLQSSTALAKSSPLVVNIDNPNFRKLIVAVPNFVVDENGDDELRKLAKDGATQLSRLLNFSGLFNIIGEAAYKDLIKSGFKAEGKSVGAKKGLEGINHLQWKGIGVESLTIGEIKRESGSFTVLLRTVDIYRGKLVVGKRFVKVKARDFPKAIRRYADRLLEAYTGKPGIFSSKLVFIGRKNKQMFKQVFVCDFDGSNVIQITNGRYPHLSPAWSKDGRFITYTSYQDGNPDLFIYELATGKKKKLSGRKGLNSGSNWSFNNKLVAFTGSRAGDADIFTISSKGGTAKILIRGSGLDVDPTFSPDGKWMAFVSGRFGNPHIFRAKLKWDGDSKVRVVNDKRLTYAGWYNATPSWAPASDKMVFAGYDRDTDRFDLFMMNIDGTKLERLTIRAGDNERPNWSPNGQMIVFQSNRSRGRDIKGQNQLFVMNRDGSGQRRIPTGLYDAQTPDWGPPLQ
jgi:TolB protein